MLVNILSFECTFDNFGVSFMQDGKILENHQIDINMFQEYGGIFPGAINSLSDKVLFLAWQSLEINLEPDIIAYSHCPGLFESLNSFNKIKPILKFRFPSSRIVKINHIYAHFYAFFLKQKDIIKLNQPIIYVILSGGNTMFFKFFNNKFELLGQTIDIALGDCLDKIARNKFSLSSGAELDNKSKYSSDLIKLPKIKIKNLINRFDISLSGIQSFLMNKNINEDIVINSLMNFILKHSILIAEDLSIDYIYIGGGVAASHILKSHSLNFNKQIYICDKEFCLDNAQNIAAAAYYGDNINHECFN